jgi:ComF family protein
MSAPWPNLLALGRGLLSGVTALIYPNACWVCSRLTGEEQGPICSHCLPQLSNDPFPTCPRCSSTVGPHLVLHDGCLECVAKTFRFNGAFRMARYDGVLRDVILRMKNWSGEDLTEVIAPLWARQLVPRLLTVKPDIVVPIPLHWMRRWQRGFNANEILALHLAKELGVAYAPHLLRRTRRTGQQTAQPNPTAREANVKGAFTASDSVDIRNKTLLLVDDVLTTGATANESARALRTRKPKAIYVVVMAHGK